MIVKVLRKSYTKPPNVELKVEQLAVLDIKPEHLPRAGDYIEISDLEGGDSTSLTGFGTGVEWVSWHYKGKLLKEIIIYVR